MIEIRQLVLKGSYVYGCVTDPWETVILLIQNFYLVNPNETSTNDDNDGSTPTEDLSRIVIALVAVITALVTIFAVTIITMKKRMDIKSRNLQSSTNDTTENPEAGYEFLNERMVRKSTLYSCIHLQQECDILPNWKRRLNRAN